MKLMCSTTLLALFSVVVPCSGSEKLTIPPRLAGAATANIAAYLPDSTVAVATVHVGTLLQKLPLERQLSRIELGIGLAQQMGFRLVDIAEVTVALPVPDSGSLALFFTLREPLEQSTYLSKHFPDAKPDATKKYFVSEKKTTTLSFLNSRTLLVTANEQSMQLCLAQAANTKAASTFTKELRDAATHDVSLWVSGSVIPKEIMAIPPGVEALTATIDVGETLQLNVRVLCEDEASQAWSKKMLRGGADLLRAQLLMVMALGQMSDVLPEAAKEMGQMLNKMGLPAKLMTAVEQGLQKAELKTDTTAVCFAVTVPLDAKTLRSELLALLRLIEANGLGGGLFGTTTVVQGQTLPSPHYLQHAPQTITPVGPHPVREATVDTFPLQREAVPTPAPAPAPIMPNALPMVGNYPVTIPLPPPTLIPSAAVPPVPLQPPALIPSAAVSPSPLPPSAVPLQPMPAAPVAATAPTRDLTIVVANTCTDSVAIYEVCSNGEYKPVGNVNKGDSADLKLKAGQRYLAILPPDHSPYQRTVPRLVTFTPEKANDIWLLRPKKE